MNKINKKLMQQMLLVGLSETTIAWYFRVSRQSVNQLRHYRPKRKQKEKNMKTEEKRLRRKLDRHGFKLMKNRTRNPEVPGYGGYMIADRMKSAIVAGAHGYNFSMTLDDVATFIDE